MCQKNYKVIVAHPGKQHSLKLAESLKNKDILFKYITTVYNKPNSLTNILSNLILNKNIKKRSKSRLSNNINDTDIKQFYEVWGLFLLILVRIPKLVKIYRYLNDRLIDKFGEKVAKYAINNNVDAVIMYDSSSIKCFEILKEKAPHIKRIMDVSIMTRPYMKKIFENDMNITNNNFKEEYSHLWNNKNLDRYQKEIEYSEYFLAPSNAVKKSLIYCGVDSNQIKIVPYGVDINKFQCNFSKNNTNSKLKLLFVGQINTRKGVHHLLNAITKIDNNKVELILVGNYDASSQIYAKYQSYENIKFNKFVTHDVLKEIYSTSDVFILPSLAEGLALVGLEALSSGLPIICSEYTGVNDIIENGKNGLVISASSEIEIIDSIEWFINNRDRITSMKKNARKSSEEYSWDKYYKRVEKAILNILEEDK